VKVGFKTPQTSIGWAELLATWELGDQIDLLDSAWLFDHFAPIEPEPRGSEEGWTLAAALASRTTRLRFGHLVLGNTHRHPALLARMASTMDRISDGRFVLGLGAGWHEGEHAMYGWSLPSIGERMTMLADAVHVLKGMWAVPDGFSASGRYPLSGAVCDPPPLTPGGPKVWLGTQGLQRGLRLVAERADGWNSTRGGIEEFKEKRDALLRHCEAAQRDPSEIEVSVQVFWMDRSHAWLATCADYVRAGAQHVVLALRPGDGRAELERVVREVVRPLKDNFS
jgi:alkanesulfonate monooxygenase SsuD/methylene tetrahydromethanopterin reductase-like flavin-dependent oxidoreductase (luciferase family)